MDIKNNKKNASKVYCTKCDIVFESREQFEKHFEKHSSGISCESCPLDIAIEKLVNLFKGRN